MSGREGESLTRRQLGAIIRGWRSDPNRNPGDPVPPDVTEAMLRKALLSKWRRRTLLERSAIAVGVPYVIDKTGTALWEIEVPTLGGAQIDWMQGQKERLANTDSLCLAFGGATIRKADGLTAPIVPDLAPFGAVGAVDYVNNGFDVEGIADRIVETQQQYPNITKLSVYGHSLGTQVASRVLEALEKRGSNIKLSYLMMDCTPPDLSYTDEAAVLDPFATFLNIVNGSSLVAGAANEFLYGSPLQVNAAPPQLLEQELVILQQGMQCMQYLSERVKRDHTRVGFLTPEHPVNDNVTDAARSRRTLLAFFPGMDTFYLQTEIDPVTGKEVPFHASPDRHTPTYKKALAQARRKWGLAA